MSQLPLFITVCHTTRFTRNDSREVNIEFFFYQKKENEKKKSYLYSPELMILSTSSAFGVLLIWKNEVLNSPRIKSIGPDAPS